MGHKKRKEKAQKEFRKITKTTKKTVGNAAKSVEKTAEKLVSIPFNSVSGILKSPIVIIGAVVAVYIVINSKK